MSNWLRYQKRAARQWSNQNTSYNNDIAQAYRLYTLALAQQPELAAMNRLRESNNLSNDAKWRLAAAYALVGKTEVANSLAKNSNIDFKPHDHNYRTYGSPFRNRAMALETMVIIDNAQQRKIAESLAKDLSSKRWYSTQETAFALMALGKMVTKNGGKAIELEYIQNGKKVQVKTDRAIAQRDIEIKMGMNSLEINNQIGNVLYVSLVRSGKLPVGEELERQDKLKVKVNYLDSQGEKLDVSRLRQGTEIKAQISVFNSTDDGIENIALTQIVPSGWEIVDTSFVTNEQQNNQADYTDVRDDRTHLYFYLGGKKTKVFNLKMNASYLGDYYLPGTQVEAMYDNTALARSKGQWVKVVQ